MTSTEKAGDRPFGSRVMKHLAHSARLLADELRSRRVSDEHICGWLDGLAEILDAVCRMTPKAGPGSA